MSNKLVGVLILWTAFGLGSFGVTSAIKHNAPVLAGLSGLLIVAGLWAFAESRKA